MATSGNKARRKLPAAAASSIPTTPAVPAPAQAPAMTADEAAPAIEAAHDAASMAAAPLVAAAEIVSAIETPATSSPNPDADPAPADTATTADEDMTMDTTTIQNNVKDAAEKTSQQAQAMFADVQDRTKGAVEKGQQLLAEIVEFNKGNVEALVESSKIAASGLQTMGQDVLADAKASFEASRDAMQQFATVKSPTEFMKLHADYARSAFDTMVQQASRRTEASLKLAGEIAQPISNRVALAAEKVRVAA